MFKSLRGFRVLLPPHDPPLYPLSRPSLTMVVFKKIKSFEVVFTDPEKVYCSGEKVAGRVTVEVCEVTRVKAVRVLACGVAKVLWLHGSQQCKQTLEYLRYEDTLLPEDQPTGERAGLSAGGRGLVWGEFETNTRSF